MDQVSQDLIGKPVRVRRGPATVKASDPTSATVREHGKASGSDEPKPGELPDRRFLFDLRATGKGSGD